MDPTTNGNHSPPPPPPPLLPHMQIWKYDVYLSFRGEVRRTFVDHLYEALTVARIHTFKDDEVELQVGREISLELMLKTIEESRISIVIFSKNYASSTWCLDELVKIIDCQKTRGQLVLPLFYDVHPSDVRKQNGTFGEAFQRFYERDELKDRLQRWRCALVEAANLSGFDLGNDGFEAKFIKKVVKKVQLFLARNNMVALEEEEAKLKEEEQTHREKMEDLQKQMEAINLQAEVLCSRRANLVTRRSSLEEMKRQFGSDDMKILQ